MKNIAVVCGGYSGEDIISRQSAANVMENMDTSKYQAFVVEISKNIWKAKVGKHWIAVDKNDFSFLHKDTKITFDAVLMMIHGTPGENGLLQGYFSTLDLPVTTGDVLNMALTFNKFATNAQLAKLNFNVAPNTMLQIGDEYNQNEILEQLQLPCFVKPNEAGSSLGISKVNEANQLEPAIKKAFEVNDSVMIEAFLKGREIQCGVIPVNGKLQALAPTEIISENEFFDFEAKYEGKSQEITPANITEQQTKLIQETSEKIYKMLNCAGFVRIDYMLDNEKVQIIEINTVPGFSKMSILPQQIKASGIEIKEALSQCIEQALT